MSIQVIEGKTKDPDGLHHRLDVWRRELMPGAIGYLGSAGGCTASGDCILIARFESEDAARANSDRPEQAQWWRMTEAVFDGPVRFHDSVDVQVMSHGRLEEAAFVQVMEGHVTDRAKAAQLEVEAEPILAEARPDLLGAITAYFEDGEFTEVAYFTSEEEARRREAAPPDEAMAPMMAAWGEALQVERYLDLTEPWLVER